MEPSVECLKLKGHVFLEIGCSQLAAASLFRVEEHFLMTSHSTVLERSN